MVPARECQVFDVPVIYIWDVVSWIYQHSKHAAEESSTLSLIGKYWIGLTRFMQNPLSEHAALSAHITAISFGDENQHLVEKLLIALERVLVDMTNKVSVEINRMVMDSYYQHLLPLVCVLGPRKVNTLVRKIATLVSNLYKCYIHSNVLCQGGILVNRGHFIKSGLLTTKIFLNEDGPDPLDATCIHLEDYELA
ncbi:hypothetical protein PISMIDRAFT_122714 [Pisolithus microcarpus 441]|uniref:Transcription elongation factor Spt6 helix-hairpin-helix motif domain-containing protein n=1 Tax=Pisolithus microcarpus 441 TaxID=765257 RepID=A0A0C9YMF6_9AGAM|nr:hypothetical protein PISMIDRAFT_122714 [Pisolithus microcarpus 441]